MKNLKKLIALLMTVMMVFSFMSHAASVKADDDDPLIPLDGDDPPEAEMIEEVTIIVEAPECGTVVTADMYGDEGETQWIDGGTQNPLPDVSVPDGAPYGLYDYCYPDSDMEGGWYCYTGRNWVVPVIYEGDYYSWNEYYVSTEDEPQMVGGETYYMDIILRVLKDTPFDVMALVDGGLTVEGGEIVSFWPWSSGGPAYYIELMVAVEAKHVEGEPETENEKAPTCLEDGSHDEVVYCEKCDTELSRETVTDKALGHDWDEWKTTKEPTKTEEGEKERVCKRDASHKETDTIPKLDPEYFEIVFDLNGGELDGVTGTMTYACEEGTVIELPEPTREGFLFDYWEGSKYYAGDKYTVTEDHNFKAMWKEEEKKEEKKDDKVVYTAPKTGIGTAIPAIVSVSALSAVAVALKKRNHR